MSIIIHLSLFFLLDDGYILSKAISTPSTCFCLLLCSKELANFHRPKALWYPHDNEMTVRELQKLPTQGPMKIILKSLGGKGSKHIVDPEETVSSIMAKASKKLGYQIFLFGYFSLVYPFYNLCNVCVCCMITCSFSSLSLNYNMGLITFFSILARYEAL